MTSVTMTVNGKAVTKDIEPRMLLSTFLREELGLTGTHVGCDTSQCGCCVVHVDGDSVKACTALAVQFDGASVTTIEGLGQNGSLHPMQEAFRENHGLQPDAVVFARGTSCAPNQPCTVDELIRYRLDLHSVPRKPLIRALAECCNDPLDRNQLLWLCSKSQKDLYSYVVERQQLSLGELLFMLPSCAPSLQTLLGVCSPMPPRYYSIASSPLVDRRRVAVAFSVVNYAVDPAQHGAEADHGYDASATSGIPRAGLCTNWLERLCAPWLHPDAGAE